MEKRIFEREKFNRLNAWEWMIQEAAFADTKRLKRGQLRSSYRDLARIWGWKLTRVSRFFDEMRSEQMIGTVAERWGTLITICNYEEYQVASESSGTVAERSRNGRGTVAEHSYKEGKKEESTEANASVRQKRFPRKDFDEWWETYPDKVGKGTAERAFAKALTKTSIDQLMAGVAAYKVNKPVDRAWCHPATWLNGERWLDRPAAMHNGAHYGSNGATVSKPRPPREPPIKRL